MALPGLGTSLLSQRLKQMEGYGLIRRERLPAPAASTVYVLTESGMGLGPIVAALAAFGAVTLGEPGGGEDVDVVRFLRLAAASTGPDVSSGGPPRVQLHIGDRVVHLRPGPATGSEAGGVLSGDGPVPGGADVVITIDAARLPDLALARRSL
ncbi:MAG: transcriptional regulator, partial [Streptosporangiales bacterium]|nr:transcriptional regulator [Streptosporangiales bacterium]